MWKFFAVIMAMSDTGSVSVSNVATDFADPHACQAAVALYPSAIERDIGGHHVTIRASAECRPDGGQPAVTIPIPGPFAPLFRR
jgi:hypothetical protein